MKKIIIGFLISIIFLIGFISPVLGNHSIQVTKASDNTNAFIGGRAKMPDDIRAVLEPIVRSEASKYELNGVSFVMYTELILAIIMVETGGDYQNYPDVMQCSESKGLAPNTIATKEESIAQGVYYLHSLFLQAYDLQLTNQDIKAVIQSYNFGGGFLPFYKENSSSGFSESLAKRFSESEPGNYGDYEYVAKVLSFLEIPELIGKYVNPIDTVNTMTERFGEVENPTKPGAMRQHNGIDITCQYSGEPIKVIANGTVMFAGQSGGYGNYVQIKHDERTQSNYGHMSGFAVSNGTYVNAGQVIGYCGSTGWSTGNHLHLELVIDGAFVDPEPYFPYKRNSLVTP